MYHIHPDFPSRKPVTGEQLQAALEAPVLQTAGIPGPLVIVSIRMVRAHGFTFVITRAADGREGIAIAGGNWRYFHPILSQKIAPYLVGTDARDLETILERIYVQELNYKIQGLAYWCCVAWVEASVIDLLGRAAGRSMTELFGPRCHDHVDYYVASGNRDTTPEREIEILAERVAEVGARAVKFKIGGRMSRDADAMEGRSEELIRRARRYFGDGFAILADGNGSFSPQTGIRYGRMLEEAGAYFYEEPCPFDSLWETKEVADALDIPLAFGEQETSLRRFRWLVENDAAQVLQPDIQYNGGFIRTSRVARMAALAGVPLTMHISGDIQYAYVLLFASVTPNVLPYQEMKSGYPETRNFFTTPLQLRDGRMRVPEGPGLGMAFDRDFFDRAEEIFLCEEPRIFGPV
jgi:L-alanine-DL-glutamate epimerase-like enolase superfamily enzyme